MESRGQVLPLMAVCLTILLGAAAMAVDVGYLRYAQRIQQSATDSAAVAAGGELIYPNGGVAAAARGDAALNAFTDDGTNVLVTVNNPPASGPYAGNASAVEVIIRNRAPMFFAQIFGMSQQWIQTRAVARITNTSNTCIYALSGDITLHGGGGGGINAPTCGLITNANLNVTGQANVNALQIGYVGNGPGGGSYPLGQPMRTLSVTDPCPTYPGCAYLARAGAALHTGCMPQSPFPDPIPPGEYCQPFNPGTATLAPGLFVLDQGMSMSGNATLSGTAVTIYNLGGLTLSGHVSVDLSAPKTGDTVGMVYFQPQGNTNSVTINGRSGTDNLVGAVYMPSADLTYNGNVPNMTFLVAASITMNGGGMGAGPSPDYQGLPHAVLAE
ncbi:MAG TPA: Tad domain-containing protein [Candidatus Elarobacter sp.]|nr:Tad domain-containing protein [Candidatus Elarobacter sp.]